MPRRCAAFPTIFISATRHDTFYYRRKERIRAGAAPPWNRGPGRADRGRNSPALALTTAWVDTIRQASERVAALVPAANAQGHPAPPQASAWQLAPALDLLRHERFGEALDYVRSGPPEAETDPDVLLVKAMLLAQDGQLAAAEACLRAASC